MRTLIGTLEKFKQVENGRYQVTKKLTKKDGNISKLALAVHDYIYQQQSNELFSNYGAKNRISPTTVLEI